MILLRLAALLAILVAPHASSQAPLPWGDQGDGSYRNPILPADYSDPDVIRVGDDFYMVSSEFHFMGIQVLHSRDLVNWSIVGQVYDRLDMDPKYAEMRAYSQGTWAPSLRYRDGAFYLYVCTPQDGLFRWTATNPAGPWSERLTVKSVSGWEDPCPLWDDDGQAYLARSRVGAGVVYLHKMNTEGTELLDEGVEIYRGPVAEGPKLYKRNGWYYISLPEGGVETGGQTVLRARDIYGPYERRVVMTDGSPHQGGIVELDNGESWFIGFKSAGHLGRVAHLEPVEWIGDWPVFGDRGRPVVEWKKPSIGIEAAPSAPQASDAFDSTILQSQWQWNHNPVDERWSLHDRPGWLRLRGLPAESLALARNTLTQKLWGEAASFTVVVDGAALAEGQRAGLAFMSGKVFDAVGVVREDGELRVFWGGALDARAASESATVYLKGKYEGAAARLYYSFDGIHFSDTGLAIELAFSQWKGARLALFCYGYGDGAADFDSFVFEHGSAPVALDLPARGPIDREALVARHAPVLREIDYSAPLTVGNGGFAFTVDATGLQTFGAAYYERGIPLETLARWRWTTDPNPHGYALDDAGRDYIQADGSTIRLPTEMGTPAADWLRRNPRLHPLGRIALEWDKPDGSEFAPEDVENLEQTLDLWRGVIVSRYTLGGAPVKVTTACDSETDTVSVRIESPLVASGQLRARVAFPRGHDPSVKNTPPLLWDAPEAHVSRLADTRVVEREVNGARYAFASSAPLRQVGAHAFVVAAEPGAEALEFSGRFAPERAPPPDAATARRRSAERWERFWKSGAAVDFSGSSNPLASKVEERMILSRYLTAAQCVADVPPQESGLTANTWYGKHHTEMIWWHAAHFIPWGQAELAERNLDWYRRHLPSARERAAERGLRGARWPKMVGPDGRESPGGNPLIAWNQPHPIYLAYLIWRQSPAEENLRKYRELVFESADCLASMLHFDEARGEYVLGPPLWIAQEIHDPATSQNPSFELAYWRWALEAAQIWRTRSGMPREALWDHIIENLPPLPQADGKYVALESHPDTWTNLASRHDHPQMLMPLGFLPATDYVDRETMNRTLDAVLEQWDWKTKIWGWDYPMVAMTATRLGRPEDALEILMREGPNNRYTAAGHCPQGSDRAQGSQTDGRPEIAVYLPANGSFLAALALMVAGWQGCEEQHPGFPKDGTWTIRAEGLQRLP